MAVVLHSWICAEEKWELKATVSAVDLDRGAKCVLGAWVYFQLKRGKNVFDGNGILSQYLDILCVAGIDCHWCSGGNVNYTPIADFKKSGIMTLSVSAADTEIGCTCTCNFWPHFGLTCLAEYSKIDSDFFFYDATTQILHV